MRKPKLSLNSLWPFPNRTFSSKPEVKLSSMAPRSPCWAFYTLSIISWSWKNEERVNLIALSITAIKTRLYEYHNVMKSIKKEAAVTCRRWGGKTGGFWVFSKSLLSGASCVNCFSFSNSRSLGVSCEGGCAPATLTFLIASPAFDDAKSRSSASNTYKIHECPLKLDF